MFEKMSPSLSDTQRTANRNALVSLHRNFQRSQQQFNEDRDASKQGDIQQIIQLATKAVHLVATSENYDIILQNVSFVNADHDITNQFILKINEAAPQ